MLKAIYSLGFKPFSWFYIYSLGVAVRERILELIQTNPNLPPLPEILFGLQKIIDDPDCEVEDVYRLIKTDPVLSGRLITLANSALWYRSG